MAQLAQARSWDCCTGQLRDVADLAFSPDGSLLAVASSANEVFLYRVSDGALALTLTGHSARVTSVAFSPDGQRLVSGSWDHTWIVWEPATGEIAFQYSGHTSFVNAVAYSPDGAYLATGGEDDIVNLWIAANGTHLYTLTGPTLKIVNVAFSPNSAFLAGSSGESDVHVWTTYNGGLSYTLQGHSNTYTIAFSPTGPYLALAAWQWNPATSSPVARILFSSQSPGHSDVDSAEPTIALDMAYTPSGLLLVTAADDQENVFLVKLWDTATGALLRSLDGHTGRVWAVAVSPDGSLIASAGEGGEIILWGLP